MRKRRSVTESARAMRNSRGVHAVLFVTVGYLILLSLWLNLFFPHSEPGTEGFQMVFLVCLYACALGLSIIVAERPSRVQRRIEQDGVEGWATIRSARELSTTRTGRMTELDLEFTVPGWDSYRGLVVHEVHHRDLPCFAVGETISVWVDPENRNRVVLHPQP